MRQWLEQWGCPEQIQFDHGQPWCANNRELPSLFELWLVGLGIQVVWSRPRRPQDNGIVERSHRTTQAWSTPHYCRSLQQLQHHLDQCVHIQRQLYPGKDGLTRAQRHPDLHKVQRPYCIAQEDQLWQLQRVYDYLATGCWQRKVDASGRISLYNRNYTIASAYAKQTLWVRFDPMTGEWCCFDQQGQEVKRCPSQEINAQTIRDLRCHRSAARGYPQQARGKPQVAPPS